MRTRRVGTLTLGLTLITFGILFLFRIFSIFVDYTFILKLWPIVFIFLGMEIIVSYFREKNERFTYDFASIGIIFFLSIFAVIMAGVEYAVTHGSYSI